MKVLAKRPKTIMVDKEIDIFSVKHCDEPLDANRGGKLLIDLKRKCAICGELYKHGDMVSMVMYSEDREERSGCIHTNCLETKGS